MIRIIINHIKKRYGDFTNAECRRNCGIACGICGIMFNVLLFAVKLTVGLISGSIAVIADAFNNLSDAGGSLITLIGFKLAGKRPDSEHPFGHGRLEYVSALLVAVLILVVGFELITTSVEKIIAAQKVDASVFTIVILAVSILIKLYMMMYNRKYGKIIDSQAMMATSDDSRNDAITTSAVLIAIIIENISGIAVDGICGALVGLFILVSGARTAFNTISTLIGKPTDKKLLKDIYDFAVTFDGILGVHDIVVHDYGPGRMVITLRAEVASNADAIQLHNVVERLEFALEEKYACDALVHMDPVMQEDETTLNIKKLVTELLSGIHIDADMHDFRMSKNGSNTMISFDAEIPYAVSITDDVIKLKLETEIMSCVSDAQVLITVDRK